MIRRASALLLAFLAMLLVLSIASTAQSQSLLTSHTRDAVVNGEAQSLGRLPAAHTMKLGLMLALRHQPELENFLQELYDPSSPSYRHFLTVQEFTARFGPSQDDYDAVVRFAKANGLKVIGHPARNRMLVQVEGNVVTIEKALHLELGLYQHPAENRTFYAPDREPSVDLPFQLWHISGLDNYSLPYPLFKVKPEGVHSEISGSCPQNSYCGSDMRAAYYEGTVLTGAGQSLGLLEFYGTDLADLTTYYKNVHQTLNVPVTLVSTDGSSVNCVASQGCDDTEQTIDMTQAAGMAPNLSSMVMYVGSSDTAILNGMATANPLNAQLSSSWGWGADPGTDDPIFEEFAAQGQNFFQASADSGAYRNNAPWPCNAAYVTSVGGTDLVTQSAGGPWKSETAWADGGGGWGNDVPIPYWQVAAAAGCSQCSQTYRNAPDVAAEANFDFYYCSDQSGCGTGLGGTSFAAPMWAGYMALVNQQAAANGEPTLGFINAEIYSIGLSSSYGTDFHDITSGSNGFSATTGYDPATGWGSPNDAGLINSLTGQFFTLTPNPYTLAIPQGNTGTSTITVVTTNGFNGAVTLSASGLPNGVTAAFSPNPTTSTSTLTLTVGAGAASGETTIVINGAAGSLTSEAGIQLTVKAGGPVVALNPTSLTWGKVKVGKTGGAKKVTVTNTGGSTLTFSSIATTGEFARKAGPKKTDCGTSLAAGKTCTVRVVFEPTQTGLLTGSLLFTDNAPGSPQSVALSGTGK